METKTTSSEVHLFYGKDYPFSNMYPCQIPLRTVMLNCSEQLYMIFKAAHFDDRSMVNRLIQCKNGYEAKKLAKEIRDYDQARWDAVKLDYMDMTLRLKLMANPDIKELLLKTEGILAEASWDRYWGTGIQIDHPDAKDPSKWTGRNQLGQMLMGLRNYYLYWG